MRKKTYLFNGLSLAFCVFTLFFLASIIPNQDISTLNVGVQENSKMGGVWTIQVTRADGTIEDPQRVDNIFYDEGANATIDALFMGGGVGSNFTNISLCHMNCSEIDDASVLFNYNETISCGLHPQIGTYTDVPGIGNGTLFHTFTSTCDDTEINASRIINNSGFLLAGANFTLVTLQTDDQVTVNYTLQAL